MRAAIDCAPAGRTVEARGDIKTLDASNRIAAVPDAQAGKAFAMWLHNYVIDDVDVTQAPSRDSPPGGQHEDLQRHRRVATAIACGPVTRRKSKQPWRRLQNSSRQGFDAWVAPLANPDTRPPEPA